MEPPSRSATMTFTSFRQRVRLPLGVRQTAAMRQLEKEAGTQAGYVSRGACFGRRLDLHAHVNHVQRPGSCVHRDTG